MTVNPATVSAALTLAVLCVFVFIFSLWFTVSAPRTHLLSRPAVWIRHAVCHHAHVCVCLYNLRRCVKRNVTSYTFVCLTACLCVCVCVCVNVAHKWAILCVFSWGLGREHLQVCVFYSTAHTHTCVSVIAVWQHAHISCLIDWLVLLSTSKHIYWNHITTVWY